MNLRLLLALPFLVALPAQMIACGDDDGDADTTATTTNDTSTDTTTDTTNTSTTDTTVTDTTVADTTRPDIDTPDGSVKKLQADAVEAGCDPTGRVTIDLAASVTDVVVTSPKYDAFTPETEGGTALDGYYIADQDGGLYSGVTLIVNRADETNFLPGDVISVTGELEESFCNTQLRATAPITMGTAVAAPAPIVVDPALVGAEAYEGMLVTVEDITVLSTIAAGAYNITGGIIVSFDGFDFFLSLTEGSTYNITGMVKWSFNEWRIIPRTEGDILLQGSGTETAITAIQSSADSKVCANTGGFTNGPENLTVSGVITTGKYSLTASLEGYWLSDGTQDDYSGIAVTIAKAQATNFVIGDQVTIVGDHVEFYCLTQFSASSMVKTGPGTLPAPLVLANDVAFEDLEKYEGMLVEFADILVGAEDDRGDAILGGRTDLAMDFKIFEGTNPAAGTTLTALRGVLSYDRSKYRLLPRSTDDLVAA
ncbi:MAG: hypothetical protein ACI9MR_002850, partial [Myxococcota bacterium]